MRLMSELQDNLQQVLQDISEATIASGRPSGIVQLLGVSKTHPFASIEALYDLGLGLFGENRVQEAERKLPSKEQRKMQINYIGHLQSNKARKAVELFDRIDSVDSLRLARRINRLVSEPYPILLELNTSGEEAKHGFRSTDALFAALEEILTLEHLKVEGLMTLGPLGGSEEETRASFARLRTAFEMASDRFDLPDFTELSMGMSGDYAWAIKEGSTCVRIGTALFGRREG